MVAALFLVMVFPSAGFSDPAYIYTGDFNLRIPAEPDSSKGWMADAIIGVPDYIVISDLDAGISLTHTNVFDLQIFLQSPAGTIICLNTYNFHEYFEGENYTNAIFDDEAEIPIEQGEAPFTGRFRPVDVDPYNKLSKFDGEDAYGSWRLRIYDAWDWDTGTFNRFGLMITTPEPATAIFLTLGVGLMRLRRPRSNLKNV